MQAPAAPPSVPLEELQLNSSPQEPVAAPQLTDAVPKKPRSSRKRRSPAHPADSEDHPAKPLAADDKTETSRAARKSRREARLAAAHARVMPSSHAEVDRGAPAAVDDPMKQAEGHCTQPAERPEGPASEALNSKHSLDAPGKCSKLSAAPSVPPAPQQDVTDASGNSPTVDSAVQHVRMTESSCIPAVAALATASGPSAEDATFDPAAGIETSPAKDGHHFDAVGHSANPADEDITTFQQVDGDAAAGCIAHSHTFTADAGRQGSLQQAEENDKVTRAYGIPHPDSCTACASTAPAGETESAHDNPLQLPSIRDQPGIGSIVLNDGREAEPAAANNSPGESLSCPQQNGSASFPSSIQSGIEPSLVDISQKAAAAAGGDSAALSAQQTQDKSLSEQQQQHDMCEEHCMAASNQGAAAQEDVPHGELVRAEPLDARPCAEHCMASSKQRATGDDNPHKPVAQGPGRLDAQPSMGLSLKPSNMRTGAAVGEAPAHHNGPAIAMQEPITARPYAGPNPGVSGETRAATAAAQGHAGNAAAVLTQHREIVRECEPQNEVGGSAGELAGEGASPASTCNPMIGDCKASPGAQVLGEQGGSRPTEGSQRRSSRSGAGKRSRPCFEDDVIASPPKRKRVSGAGKGHFFDTSKSCNDSTSISSS